MNHKSGSNKLTVNRHVDLSMIYSCFRVIMSILKLCVIERENIGRCLKKLIRKGWADDFEIIIKYLQRIEQMSWTRFLGVSEVLWEVQLFIELMGLRKLLYYNPKFSANRPNNWVVVCMCFRGSMSSCGCSLKIDWRLFNVPLIHHLQPTEPMSRFYRAAALCRRWAIYH